MKYKVTTLIFVLVTLSVFSEIRIDADPVNINATNTLLILCLFATLYSIIKASRLDGRVVTLVYVSILFILLSAYSLRVQVGEELSHLRQVVTLCKGIIVIFVFAYWLDEYRDVYMVSNALVVAGIVAFVGAFVQGYVGISHESFFFEDTLRGTQRIDYLGLNLDVQRAPGFLGGYGLLGVYIESAALLSAVGFLSHGRRQGASLILAVVGVVIAVAGLVVSQSRSGLVATVAGYTVFYTLATLVYSRFSFVRVIPLLLFLGCLVLIGTNVWDTIRALNRKSIFYRLQGYRAALETVVDNPVLGIGFSNMKTKLEYNRAIHNSYLNLLTGAGALSFLAYLYFKVKAIKGGVLCLKASDPRAPLAIGLLSTLAAAVVECMLWGGGIFATVVFIIIGLLICLGQTVEYNAPAKAYSL